MVNGKTITASTEFVPTTPDGTVDVTFNFDASEIGGRKLVVYEYLELDGNTVASHTDISDTDQTIYVPKLRTTIFDSENGREVVTVMATLRDETGALQSLLAGISAAGASIVTINQSTPENGAALVAVTIRTDTMQMSPEELTERLSRQRMVVGVHCGYNL